MKIPESHSNLETTRRLDKGTIVGLLIVVTSVIGGLVFEGGRVSDIGQATAALIVFGGTVGAVLITTPFETFMAAVRRWSEVLLIPSQPIEAMLARILVCSERARKNGLSCLEFEASQTGDPFFRKALNLLADGTELAQVREFMLLELDTEADRAEAEAKVWESAAGYSPAVGIMGAVVGLIQVMKHLDNVDQVGRGIAVAFVATVYGVAAANLVLLPAAGKLRARSREIEYFHEMILEGILALGEGMNPSMIKIKLRAFTHPKSGEKPRMAERVEHSPAQNIEGLFVQQS